MIFSNDFYIFRTSQFFLNNLTKLMASTIKKKTIKCELLLYIDCLLKFIITPVKAVKTKVYRACSYSKEIDKHILDNFTMVAAGGRYLLDSLNFIVIISYFVEIDLCS